MSDLLYLTIDPTTNIEPIEELSRISLSRDTETDDGCLPAGARGTVVFVHGSGDAYIVEFESPFHTLVTVERDAIEPVVGESRADLVAAARAADRPS